MKEKRKTLIFFVLLFVYDETERSIADEAFCTGFGVVFSALDPKSENVVYTCIHNKDNDDNKQITDHDFFFTLLRRLMDEGSFLSFYRTTGKCAT